MLAIKDQVASQLYKFEYRKLPLKVITVILKIEQWKYNIQCLITPTQMDSIRVKENGIYKSLYYSAK